MTQPQPFQIRSHAHFAVPQQKPSPAAQLALTLLGPSAAMGQLWAQIRRLAPHIRTVLLTGEADCGQEAVARVLLDLSPQSHRPLLELSAADAETRFLRATGLVSFPVDVVLFLPDVHNLSSSSQDAILRLMRMRRGRPFTVVAATAEDLRALVGVGRFSAELAAVLGAVRIAVPSLRERPEDIPMLISQLLSAHSLETGNPAPQPTEEFLRAAMQHSWQGNLRELSGALAMVCAARNSEPLRAVDLYSALTSRQPSRPAEPAVTRMVSLETVMNEHILSVLRGCRGNKLRAAEVLGISRSTLYRMLDAATTAQTAPLSLAS